MTALTILSHPVTYMVLVFLFTMGSFEYAVASLNMVLPKWRRTALFFCCYNAVVFYFLEYYVLHRFSPSIAIFLTAAALAPEVHVAAKDTFYHFFYLVVSVSFVLLMSYNLAILIVRGFNIVTPGQLTVEGTMAIGAVMFLIALLYLFFDTRMPFIKLENFNHLIHNPRGRYLLIYFLLFNTTMFFSILFIRELLFFDVLSQETLFNLLVLMSLLNGLILISSFLIVLFMCRLDSGAHRINIISEAANRDTLTGAFNRTGFVAKFEKTASAGNTGTFFLIDLDNFKAVNDTLGHQTGDRVLIECASIMQQVFRANDYIGRLGGDEFIAFAENLIDTEMVKSRAAALCERLSLTVEEGEQAVKVGCSIGIVIDTKNKDFTTVYQEADKALYLSKAEGKGRYNVF